MCNLCLLYMNTVSLFQGFLKKLGKIEILRLKISSPLRFLQVMINLADEIKKFILILNIPMINLGSR